MSIGIVSAEEFDQELARLSGNKLPSAQVIAIERGRPLGSTAVPQSLRKLVAEEAISKTPHKLLSETFGISQSSISAYKEGATSTATINEPNEELKAHVDKTTDFIVKRAKRTLINAIKGITPEKLEENSARNLAGIAKDMSAVVKNMEPPPAPMQINEAKIVVYKPRMLSEDEFPIIQVNE